MTLRSEKMTVAIIQARMSSKRLPGKVMAEINGKPMLYHVLKRAEMTEMINMVVVATSDHCDDDTIEAFCNDTAVGCFRGSLDDVLDRYYHAARHFDAQVIIRLTADCPLLDPGIIDSVIKTFFRGDYDYASNTLVCTYPDGLDTEVFSFGALGRAWREAGLKSEREHVTPYIRNHPELFRLGNMSNTENISHIRWTVDEPQDLDFVRSVFEKLENPFWGMQEILNLLKENPELSSKNAGFIRNEGYLKSLSDDRINEK